MALDSVSYWQRTAPALTLSSNLPSSADVVVVGSGLLGAATSYWLARSGVPVVLLERVAVAYGATGRNGGFVRAGPAESYPDAIATLGHEAARAVMEVTYASRTLLRQVLEEEEISCDYREPGALQLAITEAQQERQRREVAMLQTDGYPAQLLDLGETQDLIKTQLSPEVLSGRFIPGQGLIHSARLVQGLVQAAIRRGARAYQADVQAIEQDGTSLRLRTVQGNIQAQSIVVAANAWSGKLLPELADVIMPTLEQMQAYEPLEPVLSTAVTVNVNTGEYMQQTPSGNILIGGCSLVAPNAGLGVWESVPTEPVQEAIEQVLPRIFPQLASRLRVVQRWAGLLGCTSDMHPIVDQIAGLERAFFVGGFSGHGMPFGMRFGQLLAEAAISGTLPADFKPFRLDRPSLKKWELP